MGVTEVRLGDLFESNAHTLVNTVNCVGVMGKGIAAGFKRRFPDMYKDYVARCERGDMRLGKPQLWTGSTPWVLNFPTKDHWRSVSRLHDIEEGLDYLLRHYEKWGIRSLAVPPLGCGYGGLDWTVVGPTLRRYLNRMSVPVVLYAPHGTPSPQLQLSFLEAPMERPKSPVPTSSLALLEIVRRVTTRKFQPPVGRTKFQKLAYFATAVGIPTDLSFERGSYGPFAEDLKSVTTAMINNGLLEEERRGQMFAAKVGRTFSDALEARADEVARWDSEIDRVADLMMRMDTRAAEVAATVHYAWHELMEEGGQHPSESDVLEAVNEWKRRRDPPLDESEVASTIRHLNWLGWISAKPSSDLPVPLDPILEDDDQEVR